MNFDYGLAPFSSFCIKSTYGKINSFLGLAPTSAQFTISNHISIHYWYSRPPRYKSDQLYAQNIFFRAKKPFITWTNRIISVSIVEIRLAGIPRTFIWLYLIGWERHLIRIKLWNYFCWFLFWFYNYEMGILNWKKFFRIFVFRKSIKKARLAAREAPA